MDFWQIVWAVILGSCIVAALPSIFWLGFCLIIYGGSVLDKLIRRLLG